jgi:hypothetical protein
VLVLIHAPTGHVVHDLRRCSLELRAPFTNAVRVVGPRDEGPPTARRTTLRSSSV